MDAAELLAAASAGRLPDWAKAGPLRRAHMSRVADLMEAWAHRSGLAEGDVARWRAAAWLHDALRDEDVDALRSQVPEELQDLPPKVLHGPAVAHRLEQDGVGDPALRLAVAYHTLGHPDLDRLGRALYLADFLDPGRSFRTSWRASLRGRMPDDLDDVLRIVLGARIAYLLERGMTVRPETTAFWNQLASEH
ncbi:MAG: HD domain-containing protein [Gemmatimonadota bacterium]